MEEKLFENVSFCACTSSVFTIRLTLDWNMSPSLSHKVPHIHWTGRVIRYLAVLLLTFLLSKKAMLREGGRLVQFSISIFDLGLNRAQSDDAWSYFNYILNRDIIMTTSLYYIPTLYRFHG